MNHTEETTGVHETVCDLIPAPPGWHAAYHPESPTGPPLFEPLVGWLKIERRKTHVHDIFRQQALSYRYVAAVMSHDRVEPASGIEGRQFWQVIGPSNETDLHSRLDPDPARKK